MCTFYWAGSSGPENIMVDNSKAEIKALKGVYPLTSILLCKFHVLEFVEAWMATHGIPKKKQVKNMFRHLVGSKTEEVFETR